MSTTTPRVWRSSHGVAANVDPFQSKGSKPGYHIIDSRVETRLCAARESEGREFESRLRQFVPEGSVGFFVYSPPPRVVTQQHRLLLVDRLGGAALEARCVHVRFALTRAARVRL
jgi:hypothetical protein